MRNLENQFNYGNSKGVMLQNMNCPEKLKHLKNPWELTKLLSFLAWTKMTKFSDKEAESLDWVLRYNENILGVKSFIVNPNHQDKSKYWIYLGLWAFEKLK